MPAGILIEYKHPVIIKQQQIIHYSWHKQSIVPSFSWEISNNLFQDESRIFIWNFMVWKYISLVPHKKTQIFILNFQMRNVGSVRRNDLSKFSGFFLKLVGIGLKFPEYCSTAFSVFRIFLGLLSSPGFWNRVAILGGYISTVLTKLEASNMWFTWDHYFKGIILASNMLVYCSCQ